MCSSIRQSRKRKLRELYAVATILNGLPNFPLGHLDAPPTNDAEAKFLDANDILKSVLAFLSLYCFLLFVAHLSYCANALSLLTFDVGVASSMSSASHRDPGFRVMLSSNTCRARPLPSREMSTTSPSLLLPRMESTTPDLLLRHRIALRTLTRSALSTQTRHPMLKRLRSHSQQQQRLCPGRHRHS